MPYAQQRRIPSVRGRIVWHLPLVLLAGLFSSACTAEGQTVSQPPSAPIPTAVIARPAALCSAVAPMFGGSHIAAAPASQANASYDSEANLITIPAGADLALPDIAKEINDEGALKEIGPGDWLLRASIRIKAEGKLRISAPAVRRLRLRSDEGGFVSIKALGGTLEITGSCVTSWDAARDDVDTNYDDGRSFLLARDGGRMALRDSELSYLGYGEDESYGVAWRLPGTSGEAVNSIFSHNFYGLYLFRASGIRIIGNEVHHSVRYGIDPHTASNNLLIEGNRAHHNGKHGIILANGCNDSVIRNNEVYANELHGIVLFQGSQANLVEGNRVYDNAQEGINLNESSHNTVRDNTTHGNGEAGIGVGQGSQRNQIAGNRVYGNSHDGITLYSDARENTLAGNRVYGNSRYGIYIKSAGNIIGAGNEVYDNQVGIAINASPSPEISRSANRIANNREADVHEVSGE